MRKEPYYLLSVGIGLALSFLLIGILKKDTRTVTNYPPVVFNPIHPAQPAPPSTPAKPIITPIPEFKDFQPLRSVSNLGKVLSDIESHMPAGHIYKDADKITWGHETSHGIHSKLRMQFRNGKRINGFYVLDNRAAIIEEPNTTIRSAARIVPNSLRGGVYQLYMVSQAGAWNDTPLYVFDEWVAYSNGSAIRVDLNIQSRAETVKYMMEFNVYSICVAQSTTINDPQFKHFLMWHLERAMNLYKSNLSIGDCSQATEYWDKVKTSSDAEEFRQFARQYLGADWTKEILGF